MQVIKTKQLKPLAGMTLQELQEVSSQLGMPKFVAKQLADWIYVKRVSSFDDMLNISKANRQKLAERFKVGLYGPESAQHSADGTVKYLFAAGDDKSIESVYIPDEDRATLCISSQKGCRMNCYFCMTGRQGYHGNLTANQIVNQILSVPESSQLTNVVFMGMGEPMDNLDAVLDACAVLTSDWGLGWSPKRITVSTVGIIPSMKRFLDECPCHLAVSLHNAVPQERLAMMPVQKAYPLNQVLALLRQYDWSGQRRLSFEYTMFRGENDDLSHAAKLVEALKGLECRVNLIRFHESPEAPYKTSTTLTINAFRDYLNRHGLTCTVRASRGQDIDAACGLLAGREG